MRLPLRSALPIRTIRALGAVVALVLAFAAGPGAARPQTPPAAAGGLGRIVPVPPATRDPSLTAFLAELQSIARRRDTVGFLARLWKDIDIEFGSASGHAAFVERRQLNDPDSPFWRELEWLLTLDGAQPRADSYCVPYAAAHHDEEDRIGPYGVIVRPRAVARAAPSADAAPLATLSYDIVALDSSVERAYDETNHGRYGPPWTKIRLADGRRGYVPTPMIWSLRGMRFWLSKGEDGRWMIVEYGGGD